MTEALRRIIDGHLRGGHGLRDFDKEAVLAFVGLGRSGRADTSEYHDRPSTRRPVGNLFVDTGAFYAAADLSDAHHVEAATAFAARETAGDLLTTDHVVIETWLLLRARLGRTAALRFWDAMETGVVKVLGVNSEDFACARQIARDWPDQALSIVDCTSFAVMERLGIEEALAFDAHFRNYRFGPSRKRRFRVIP